jgi:protein-arginine kinase activator protein McsA
MDFCGKHSPDDDWTHSHEQYRPFVMFHRVHATALAALEDDGAEVAVQEINLGLRQVKDEVFEDVDQEEFEEDELIQRLIELRETLRQEYEVGRTLEEQLGDAIESEQYERAAELRDKLANRETNVL